jgi:hypothetical protein
MIATLLSCALCQTPQSSEPATRSEWTYSLDLERARAIGWAGPDSKDEDVRSIARGLLERRLRAIDEGFQVEPGAPGGILVRSPSPLDEAAAGRLDALVRSIGVLELGIVAPYDPDDIDDELLFGGSTLETMVLASEKEKLEDWLRANPGRTPVEFDLVPFDAGGPHPSLCWLPADGTSEVEANSPAPYPILLPASFEAVFGAADFERVYATVDSIGYPAVGFELKATRRSEFREFTRKHTSRAMAILLDEQVVSAPTIMEELPGEGIIRGRMSEEERDQALRRIRALEGPFRPSSYTCTSALPSSSSRRARPSPRPEPMLLPIMPARRPQRFSQKIMTGFAMYTVE